MPDYRAMARQYARAAGVPEAIFLAQINQESGFNPNARSGAGAQGIAQIVPKWHPGVNPMDPAAALAYAANWDAKNFKKYGNWNDTLSVYNSGRPWAQGKGFGETRNYVASILAGSKKFGASATPVGQMTAVAKAQGLPAPAAPTQDLRRQAVMTNLIGQQNAYLSHSQYSGPSAQQILASLTPAQVAKPQAAASTARALGAAPGKASAAPAGATPFDPSSAKKYLGVPYVWGGNDPSKALDCSSFVQNVMADHGVKVARTTYDQIKQGKAVSLKGLQPGDAVFTHPGKAGPGHVGIYIGNGQVQESPHTGDVNKIIPLNSFLSGGFVGARRYL